MSWFLCIISQKPFLEWEIEKFLKVHPQSKNTIIKPSFYFSYDCRSELLMMKKPTEENPSLRVVMGRGYLAKSTGYSQADERDWEKLLNFEYLPKDIDGHYVAIKIRENFVQVTNDAYGHYPVYYVKAEDYIVISNVQHFIGTLVSDKKWDYSSVSALALLKMPLEKKAYLQKISILPAGSTVTIRKNEIAVASRNLNLLAESDADIQSYLFSLKKAYELQLNSKDFMSIPFENNYSSRFAFSVWYHKAKKTWGLYHLQKSELYPEKHMDQFILNSLKIFVIPDFNDGEEVFRLYREHVLRTGLSDFPDYFALAGNFKADELHEINLISQHSEWLFQKEPTAKIDKIHSLLKRNAYSAFKRNYVMKNYFFRKEFYVLLLEGTKLHFAQAAKDMICTDSIYDKYHFLVHNYYMNNCSAGMAWLNDFRTFYCPGMLYSLASRSIQQRLINKKTSALSRELHISFAEESKAFPKPKEKKSNFLERASMNTMLFPLMTNEVGIMIEKSQDVPYYNFSSLIKIFNKAKKGNTKAVDVILKWVAFEIWREYIDG